jgi:hypothetical protein
MQWIEGVTWRGKQFTVSTVSADGERGFANAMSIYAMAPIAQGKPIRAFECDLHTWNRCPPSEYLSILGWQAPVADGQDVFSFTFRRTRFVVPASVLLPAFFRPFRVLNRFLFMSGGLGLVCIPNENPEEPVTLVANRFFLSETWGDSILAPLSWMWSYPSATRLWASVLAGAYRGRLSLALPKARARLSFQGVRRGWDFAVTGVRIVSLVTTEDPHPFATHASRKVVFHEGAKFSGSRDTAVLPPLTSPIPPRDGDYRLSDQEWEEVRPILVRDESRFVKHDTRLVADGVIVKLVTGVGWRRMTCYVGTPMNAEQRHRDWVKRGHWAQVENILRRRRSPSGGGQGNDA